MDKQENLETFLAASAPYAALPEAARAELAQKMVRLECAAGEYIFTAGDPLIGVYLILRGRVEVRSAEGGLISILGAGNHFGERGLLRDGVAAATASAENKSLIYLLPTAQFDKARALYPKFKRYFDRTRPRANRPRELSTVRIAELMTRDPITCAPSEPIQSVARIMRENHASCLLVMNKGALLGIVTNSDLTNRALAEGKPGSTPVGDVMTREPITLKPGMFGGDVLFEMIEQGVSHLPVLEDRKLIGLVTHTDLMRVQALSSASLLHEIVVARDNAAMAQMVARIPELLAQLVGAGHRHDVICRLITDIADAVTRRLLLLAEEKLGAPPARYVWLACGSQGRREQTGVSDQDNCLILEQDVREGDIAYFDKLAAFVTQGLAECGYFLCPGEMMASNPRWRQPLSVWRDYFYGWIDKPDPMAQMLASVMFDLRPIGGDESLFHQVRADVLERAAQNSIFVAHMVRNAVGHAPPLGIFGGMATIRSGEHKETIDMKHNGVAPVVDLARIYALQGPLRPVNTRARLEAAADAQLISASGSHDLLDAYDLIAETRLRHQAMQVKAGRSVDNYMPPSTLSDLERSHLRDAFVVVRTMQSALSQGRASVM